MGLLSRLASLFGSRDPGEPETARKPTGREPADAEEERSLRAILHENPNDSEAFAKLARLVQHRTEGTEQLDPLIADTGPIDTRTWTGASQWALAEELAGNPRAWYPLIELARLSLADDHEGAMRRLGAACERDRSGKALVESLTMLREAHLPADALALGVGHWDPAHQIPEAGRQVVQAALEAARPAEARQHLRNLAEYGAEQEGTDAVVAELEPFVAAAEAKAARSE